MRFNALLAFQSILFQLDLNLPFFSYSSRLCFIHFNQKKIPLMKTLIQEENSHKFSTDALLLAHFTPLENVHVFAELGTGCGVIALELLQRKQDLQGIAIDFNNELLQSARKNALLYFEDNAKTESINFLLEDLNNCPHFLNSQTKDYKKKCDLVITNPPWLLENQGKMPKDEMKRKALFAGRDIYSIFFKSAKYFIKERGLLSFVSIPQRLNDALLALLEQGFAVKHLQFVHNTCESEAIFVLCLAEFRGKLADSVELKILPPLYLQEEKE